MFDGFVSLFRNEFEVENLFLKLDLSDFGV